MDLYWISYGFCSCNAVFDLLGHICKRAAPSRLHQVHCWLNMLNLKTALGTMLFSCTLLELYCFQSWVSLCDVELFILQLPITYILEQMCGKSTQRAKVYLEGKLLLLYEFCSTIVNLMISYLESFFFISCSCVHIIYGVCYILRSSLKSIVYLLYIWLVFLVLHI